MKANPIEEKDPTVPAWAKSAEKPKYTAEEVGALSADDLEPLTGSTAEITPKAVNEAILAGTPVVVNYTDGTYGALDFTNFNIAEKFGVIVSQTIVYYNGSYVLAELAGNVTDSQWLFYSTTLAKADDIPTDEHINDLINTALGVIENADY